MNHTKIVKINEVLNEEEKEKNKQIEKKKYEQ